jgi:hypothetical protein
MKNQNDLKRTAYQQHLDSIQIKLQQIDQQFAQ